MRRLLLAIGLFACAVPVVAQSAIPPPSTPVTFCGTQALPAASTYQLSIDGAAAQPLTMASTVNAGCPAGTTHSFDVPASVFTVGSHTVKVTAVNTFGSTVGPTYTVTVGIAPGAFTVNAVLHP